MRSQHRNWMRAGAIAHMLITSLFLAVLAAAECPPVYEFIGESAENDFGFAVASAGDVNDDGTPDIIIGAHSNNAGGPAAGRVYVFSGLNGDTLHIFTGDSAFVQFGISVAGIGDINGDEFDDVLIGASAAGPHSAGAGRVFAYSGQTGDLLYIVTGEASGDRFGQSLAALGDLDGDSINDFITGAFFNDATGDNAGRAYVYSGANGAPLDTVSGEAAGDWFGAAVGNAGDVNNDGTPDIIVGAPLSDSGGFGAGRAYVFSGADWSRLYTWSGTGTFDQLGYAVSGVGDVNNDGFDDLIVGAPIDQDGSFRGKAFVFSGADGLTLHFLIGEDINDEFGESVAGIPDANGDGLPDFLIGTRYGGPAQAGRAYAYAGTDGSLIGFYEGIDGSDFFGHSFAPYADLDGDGWPEIIVGSSGKDANGENAGAAFVLTMSPDSDMDSVSDACDNCPTVANSDQADTNGNGIGDVCDGPCTCPSQGDFDQSGSLDALDLNAQIDILFFGGTDPCDALCPTCRSDVNCDGVADALDLNVLIQHLFFSGPPPCDPCNP